MYNGYNSIYQPAWAYKGEKMIRKFIESLRDEKDGFSFDKPWRLEAKSLGVLVPILRKSKAKRSYITFAEANEAKVEDTGQIDYVYVKNEGKKPILISRGEIFRGKSQERAAVHDHIIQPGCGLRVAVKCIHMSRGISGGSKMEYGGRAPYSVTYTSQSTTWDNVKQYSGKAWETSNTINAYYGGGSILRCSWDASTSDDLLKTIENLTDAMKEALTKIPYLDNQVGAIFFYENRMIGMDVYDFPGSWDAVKRDVVEKEGADFLKKDEQADMFEFKPEKAKILIKKYLSENFEEKEIYSKDYRVTEIRSDSLIGEIVEFGGKIIHLTLWEKEKK